jgi:2-amino-4-hydroxy-6-hydroxymethyldihydropteridine diphosphokinase
MAFTCYLLLGSNKGNKEQNLSDALQLIEKQIGKIDSQSSVFESEAWGYSDNESYLNQAISLNVNISAEDLLYKCQNIEIVLGRIRTTDKYEARTIDIDIIFYNSLVAQCDNLQLPHPRVHLRRFALEPLNEICPGYIHPVLQKTVRELLSECTDRGWVKKK